MKAPHMLVLVLTISLAAIFRPAHADAAPVTQPSLAKAVTALEAAIDATTGAKIANPEELYVSWTPVKLVRN
jgi:hypothetical protein